MIDDRVISFFLNEKICNSDFFDYISDKIVYIPSGSDVFWYGSHPILENGILCDIRVVVPIIENEFDLIVNIHEFTHAIELYDEIGLLYNENVEDREARAHNMEKIFIKNNC